MPIISALSRVDWELEDNGFVVLGLTDADEDDFVALGLTDIDEDGSGESFSTGMSVREVIVSPSLVQVASPRWLMNEDFAIS